MTRLRKKTRITSTQTTQMSNTGTTSFQGSQKGRMSSLRGLSRLREGIARRVFYWIVSMIFTLGTIKHTVVGTYLRIRSLTRR